MALIQLSGKRGAAHIKAWRRAGIVTGTRYNDKGEFLYNQPDPASPPSRPKIGRRPRHS